MLEDFVRIFERKRALVMFSLRGTGDINFDISDDSIDLGVFDCPTFAEFLKLVSFAIEQYIPDEHTRRCTIAGLNLSDDLDLSPDFWERIKMVSQELGIKSANAHGITADKLWQSGITAISEQFDKDELARLIEQSQA